MTYTQICDEYEGKWRISNHAIFHKFLEEFSAISGIDLSELAETYGVEKTDYTNLFWILHSYLFNHKPEMIPSFYQQLETYHFNLNNDYISLVRLVGHNTEDRLTPAVRNFLMRAPFIDDVSDSNGKITIHSEKAGDISFYSTMRYFSEDFLIRYLLKNFPTIEECHNISWKLTKKLPGSTLVTSLVPMLFEGTHYHTVVRDASGFIVDAANGVVYEERDFHRLFQDEIVSETKHGDLEQCLSETSLMEGRSYASALVLALHNQKKKL